MTKHININLNQRQTENQKLAILECFFFGGRLTPMEALVRFGTFKISTRVSELRDEGFPIRDQWVTLESGKKVKEYWMF